MIRPGVILLLRRVTAAPARALTETGAAHASPTRRCAEPDLLPVLDAQRMRCPTLATNAIVRWSTEYHGLGVAAPRRDADDAVLTCIWSTHHENVPLRGTHSVDIDGEPAQLGADGYRPPRLPEPAG